MDALRDGGRARVSLAAIFEGEVVGHILFSAVELERAHGRSEVLCLAPVAVLPEFRHRGIGSALIRQGLEHCRRAGHPAVLVLGDPAYYGRFGFTAAAAAGLDSPYAGPAFQGLEWAPGALGGPGTRVVFPPPFAELRE